MHQWQLGASAITSTNTTKEKVKLLFDFVIISFNIHSPFAAASHSQAAEEEEVYDSKADKDFAAELQEDE